MRRNLDERTAMRGHDDRPVFVDPMTQNLYAALTPETRSRVRRMMRTSWQGRTELAPCDLMDGRGVASASISVSDCVARSEVVISTKAGYHMWEGPYGEWGSRKYLLSSLDASLQRMGLDYVDIFYSHRPDPATPLEETMGALDTAVRSGRALYAGISSYTPEQTLEAARILKELGTPLLIHQPSYSMLNRWTEDGTPNLYEALDQVGAGSIAFSPLAQGMLTDRYLNGIPADSRAAQQRFLSEKALTDEAMERVRGLNEIAAGRGQTLAQMAIAWILRDQPKGSPVTSALVGASSVRQLEDTLGAIDRLDFTADELSAIDKFAVESDINVWSPKLHRNS